MNRLLDTVSTKCCLWRMAFGGSSKISPAHHISYSFTLISLPHPALNLDFCSGPCTQHDNSSVPICTPELWGAGEEKWLLFQHLP